MVNLPFRYTCLSDEQNESNRVLFEKFETLKTNGKQKTIFIISVSYITIHVFLDEMFAYAPSTHLIFGAAKNTKHIFRRIKNQMRRQTFYLKKYLKNVTSIWKHTVIVFLEL